MEKYFKRKGCLGESSQSNVVQNSNPTIDVTSDPNLKRICSEVDIDNLQADPGLRTKMSSYHPNDRDRIRRSYLQKGPCQPRDHDFPQTLLSNKMRRFNPAWFDEFKDWLEYSVEKDAAYCLFCYLYKMDSREQAGSDSFDSKGFRNWKKKERFQVHIGQVNSSHNLAWKKCCDLMNQDQHISFLYEKNEDQMRQDYRLRLTASIDCARFLLHQGLAFRGHDESVDSENQGNFRELLSFLSDHNEDIRKVTLENAPKNNKLVSPDIQKDIAHAAAIETTQIILKELGGDFFAILLDETRDVSVKEQVAVAIRFVDSRGCVIERFLSIVHVEETSSITLKRAIEALFAKHGLSISQLRGQGYDGASNMRGEFNGLKTLILKDNSSAHYIHCFAHQLQLALVAVAKNHNQIASFFNMISSLTNIVGSSCKRRDIIRHKQFDKIAQQIQIGELPTGRGLNQEVGLHRAGETRWGSHYGAIINIIILYESLLEVLEMIAQDGASSEQKGEAFAILEAIQCFDFIFCLHLMKSILGITNELSQTLQKKDQDIINAMCLVKISKEMLQKMRDDGFNLLLENVMSFSAKYKIIVPNMTDIFRARGRSRRYSEEITYLHHYKVDLFNSVIDMQLQELNNRFNETNTELLLCVACLNPCDAFSSFDKERLVRLATFYPSDFSNVDLIILENQLEIFIVDMRSNDVFKNLRGFGELAQKLVETRKNHIYPLVYLLVKLALVLPVATATVERAFSAMNFVKNRLRNRMGDSWMNDCLVTYIEKDVLDSVDTEQIIQRFQNMKTRREKL